MRGVPKIVDGMRECTICEKTLPLSDFYVHGIRKTTTHSECKECNKQRSKELRKLNPSRSKEAVRRFHLKKNYGLTWDRFIDLCKLQNNCCAICGAPFDPNVRDRKAHVDHDHKTGVVRGILCGFCNTGIGMLRDDISLLESAIFYLRSHTGLRLVETQKCRRQS